MKLNYKIYFSIAAIIASLSLFLTTSSVRVDQKLSPAERIAANSLGFHNTWLWKMEHIPSGWIFILLIVGLLIVMQKDNIVTFIKRQKPNGALWVTLCCIFLLSATTVIKIGQTNLQWVSVLDRGAVADGTTDNTVAFRAAAAAIPSNGGVFYIPVGSSSYLVTDSVILANPTIVLGSGGSQLQTGGGTGGRPTVNAPSTITFNTGTKDLFVVNADMSQFLNVSLVSTSSSTPTSSHGILWNKSISARQDNVSISYFYEGEHFVNGYNWSIDHTFWNGCVSYNLVIEDQAIPDAGDHSISNSWSFQGTYAGSSHFLYLSGGGLKLSNIKFNQQGSNVPLHCVNAPINQNTILFAATNCSLENFNGSGYKFIPATGKSFGAISITGGEIAPNNTMSTGNNAIQVGSDATPVTGVNISGVNFYNQGLGSTSGIFPSTVYTNWNIISTSPYTTVGANTYVTNGNTNYDNVLCTNNAQLNIYRQTAPHTITSGSSVTYDGAYGNDQFITLTSNTTINPAHLYPGHFKLRVLQNATGGFTLTVSSSAGVSGPVQYVNPAPNGYTEIEITDDLTVGGGGFIVVYNDWRNIPVAINSTATVTAAQLGQRVITSTSAAAVTMTLPTATALATQIGAVAGKTFAFTIDNSAGANPVTLTLGSGMTVLGGGSLAIPTGMVGAFNAYFTSTTACFIIPQLGGRGHTIFTPTTGGTVTLINNQYNIINPAGALLALTVALPSSPANNDLVYIKYTQNVTTVTYSGGTVVDGITAPTAGGLVVLSYDSGTTSWY